MSPAAVSRRCARLGPLLLLFGLLAALAATLGLLPFRQALAHSLAVAAAGLIACGLRGMRRGPGRLPAAAMLLSGVTFFATWLGYLAGDYRWLAGNEPLAALLPGYRGEIALRIVIVSALAFAGCLLGFLSETGGEHRRGGRRPRTAPVAPRRKIRSRR